jgi:hypothetical protein
MAVPVGTWHVVTNLYSSILTITAVDASGNLTGTIQVSATETYSISGTWDATKQQISFGYTFWVAIGGGSFKFPFSTNYTGNLFEGAGSGLFQQPPGPVSSSNTWNLLAGTWQHNLVIQPHPNGWVARMS